jgi:hypothetical protein
MRAAQVVGHEDARRGGWARTLVDRDGDGDPVVCCGRRAHRPDVGGTANGRGERRTEIGGRPVGAVARLSADEVEVLVGRDREQHRRHHAVAHIGQRDHSTLEAAMRGGIGQVLAPERPR